VFSAAPDRPEILRKLRESLALLRPDLAPCTDATDLDLLTPGEFAELWEVTEIHFAVCLRWHDADRDILDRLPFRVAELAELVRRRWGMLWGTCAECGFDLTRRYEEICPGCGIATRLCRKCGYDMAGLAAQICPECGARLGAFER
jgi:hypothetical protein